MIKLSLDSEQTQWLRHALVKYASNLDPQETELKALYISILDKLGGTQEEIESIINPTIQQEKTYQAGWVKQEDITAYWKRRGMMLNIPNLTPPVFIFGDEVHPQRNSEKIGRIVGMKIHRLSEHERISPWICEVKLYGKLFSEEYRENCLVSRK